jgi:hypothetical protein
MIQTQNKNNTQETLEKLINKKTLQDYKQVFANR